LEGAKVISISRPRSPAKDAVDCAVWQRKHEGKEYPRDGRGKAPAPVTGDDMRRPIWACVWVQKAQNGGRC